MQICTFIHRRRVWGGGGLRGSAPAEILLNSIAVIAVTILANPETLDVAKKDNIHT